MSRSKDGRWFKAVRGSYLPRRLAGWLIYLPYLFVLIWGMWSSWHYTHDYAMSILLYIPWAVTWAVILQWLASRL